MTDIIDDIRDIKLGVSDKKDRDEWKIPFVEDETIKFKDDCQKLDNSSSKNVENVRLSDAKEMEETIYDILRDIKDPEKPETLEELNVLKEDSISVSRLEGNQLLVSVEFTPTVPHCSLASLIGLTIRSKLQQALPEIAKVDINIKDGTHDTAEEINKQINDKERIAAAMENPNLKALVKHCTSEDVY